MNYLTVGDVHYLHRILVEESGGSTGLLNMAGLESAVAQPRMTFDRCELYSTIEEKASALGFSPAKNHPFTDGNKRIAHTALESFLGMNGYELRASVDESEKIMMSLAAGKLMREQFTTWATQTIGSLPQESTP